MSETPIPAAAGEPTTPDTGTVALVSRSGPELTTAELYGMLRLRVDVFVVEQECPYPELDGRDLDATTRHIWAVTGGVGADGTGTGGRDVGGQDVGGADRAPESGATVGCLRVLRDPDGTARIGRVCTAARVRGTGLGARLMRAALDVVGDTDCVLDAQTYATGFYARFGFHAEGDEFDEDGIPHVTMRRPRA